MSSGAAMLRLLIRTSQLAVVRSAVNCIRLQPLQASLHTTHPCLRGHGQRGGGLGDVVASFKDVTFGYGAKEILEDASFSIREGAKVTIMGQVIPAVVAPGAHETTWDLSLS